MPLNRERLNDSGKQYNAMNENEILKKMIQAAVYVQTEKSVHDLLKRRRKRSFKDPTWNPETLERLMNVHESGTHHESDCHMCTTMPMDFISGIQKTFLKKLKNHSFFYSDLYVTASRPEITPASSAEPPIEAPSGPSPESLPGPTPYVTPESKPEASAASTEPGKPKLVSDPHGNPGTESDCLLLCSLKPLTYIPGNFGSLFKYKYA